MTAATPGLRTVFALPQYRRLWAARTVSQWGDVVQTVTLALLVYELTGSGLGVAAVVAATALVGYGVATSTGAVTFTSMLQAETPDHLRGRVFASMDVLWQTGRLVSLGLGAVLADTVGVSAVYLLGGVLLLLAAGFGFVSGSGRAR